MSNPQKIAHDSIKCPACGELIAITETLHHQLTEQARAELRSEVASQQKAQQAREAELQQREERVQQSEQAVQQQVRKQLETERVQIGTKALQKAREEVSLEVNDLRNQAAENARKAEEAQQNELRLRREKRELETAKKAFELEATRKLIITDALPKHVSSFALENGVWIGTPRLAVGIAFAFRQTLIEVARAKTATAAKNEIIESLFKYLTGPEFRHRVEAIIAGFVAMKDDLDEERIAQRRWAKREKQLELIIGSTSGMYGDLQGLVGTSLQPIPALESGQDEPDRKTPLVSEESEISDEDIPF